MRPEEYRQLIMFDNIAEYAEQKGRADGEGHGLDVRGLRLAQECDGDRRQAKGLAQMIGERFLRPASGEAGRDLEVAVALGTDPALLFATVAALPFVS